jgi:signal transduction histidine kinase
VAGEEGDDVKDRNIVPLLIDYVMREAALIVVVMDRDGTIEQTNRHMEILAGGSVISRPFSALIVDFHGTFTLDAHLAREDGPFLFNVTTSAGMPETYYFHFHGLDGRILAIGQQDHREAKTMRQSLMGMNNELNNLTRQLKKKTIALQRLDAQKNQFFGMAAHDIRHPLTIIKMFSEFLETEAAGTLGSLHAEFLGHIIGSARLMENILNDFLDFSVFEAGRLSLEKAETDMAAWLEKAAHTTGLVAAQKGVMVVLLPCPDRPLLAFDVSKMTQVLSNLLSNALKFSAPGSRVEVGLQARETEVILSVRDQGPGISLENQRYLFNPFIKLRTAPKTGEKGSGLGLAIVKKIVDAHGGRVWVESEEGLGAAFFVGLPLASVRK